MFRHNAGMGSIKNYMTKTYLDLIAFNQSYNLIANDAEHINVCQCMNMHVCACTCTYRKDSGGSDSSGGE